MKLICILTSLLLLASNVGSAVIPNYNKPIAFTISSLYNTINLDEVGLKEDIFALALKGFSRMQEKGILKEDSILTIIDYTKSSKEKRLYVIDLKNQEVDFHTVVSHGRNSGYEYAKSFSNKTSSNKSSIGFFITGETYQGSNGYSLKLQGADPGYNDKAMKRAIVMHGAPYANESIIDQIGFLGRSLGCPAIPQYLHRKLIDKIKNGNALFIYYPQPDYLFRSPWLKS